LQHCGNEARFAFWAFQIELSLTTDEHHRPMKKINNDTAQGEKFLATAEGNTALLAYTRYTGGR
jgi:hypothetical protein